MRDANSVKREWEVGLSSWIIQDGNYDNFETDQRAEFALEFYPQSYQKSAANSKSAKSLGAARYEIVGQVIYLTPEVWALDFGLCAFQESKPLEGIELGGFVAAEIYLGIDPFFYCEYLHARPNMPPLICSWTIKSICQQTAPFIQSREASGQIIQIRDASKLGYKTIGKTDAWKDDGGNAEYILTCARLDIPPKNQSTSAT